MTCDEFVNAIHNHKVDYLSVKYMGRKGGFSILGDDLENDLFAVENGEELNDLDPEHYHWDREYRDTIKAINDRNFKVVTPLHDVKEYVGGYFDEERDEWLGGYASMYSTAEIELTVPVGDDAEELDMSYMKEELMEQVKSRKIFSLVVETADKRMLSLIGPKVTDAVWDIMDGKNVSDLYGEVGRAILNMHFKVLKPMYTFTMMHNGEKYEDTKAEIEVN